MVILRINVDLAIFQPYLDLETGDNQSLKIQAARPGIEPRSSCSASQELNHSATTAPLSLEVRSPFTIRSAGGYRNGVHTRSSWFCGTPKIRIRSTGNFLQLASVDWWSSAYVISIIYKFLNECPFDYTPFAIKGRLGSRKPVLPHQFGGNRYHNWPS